MTQESPRSRKSPLNWSGCGFLFLLPFACVGLFMGYLYVSLLWEAHRAQSWVEVPAWIDSSKLHRSMSKGSSTYRTTAQYRYEVNGINYTGTRVGYTDSNDNIGGFHQTVYEELQRHQQEQKPFRCFVNPDAPHESILYREVRLSLLLFYSLFVFAFGGIGIGGLLMLVRSVFRSRRTQSLREQFPDEPWRWKSNVQDGVYSQQVNHLPMIVSLVWNLFTWTPVYIAFDQIKSDLWSKLFLIAPLAGLASLWWTSIPLRQRMRFGNVRLRIEPWPYRISERLKGTLEFPSALPTAQELTVTLTVKRQVPGQYPGAELFSETKIVHESAMDWDFEFELPSDLPPAEESDESGDAKVHWQVRVRGGGLQADYEIDAVR